MKTLIPVIAAFVCSASQAQAGDSSLIYFQKAVAAKEARQFLVAAQYFDKSLSFNAQNLSALLENAAVHMEMRKTDQAKALYIQALELEPGNLIAQKQLMQLYFNYRQFAKAVEMAKACANCEGASRIIGISLYQQEEYVQAVQYLSQALQQNEADAEATYIMARCYLDMEEYSKAVPYYAKAINLNPEKSNWIYEKGLLHYTLNEYKDAVSNFQLAADKGYVQSNDFKENLGYACLYSGEFDKGESLLMSVWQKKPGNKDIIRDMAEILYKGRQYDRSLQYCQKLLEMDAKDGKALYQAGLCFQKKGEKDRGQAMCDKAIEMDPSLASLRRKKEMPGGL